MADCEGKMRYKEQVKAGNDSKDNGKETLKNEKKTKRNTQK